jgi:hypothetical protein
LHAVVAVALLDFYALEGQVDCMGKNLIVKMPKFGVKMLA